MATHSSTLAWKIPWSLVDYSPWGHKESDKTERLHFTFKVSIEFVTVLLLFFYVFVFSGTKAYGILAAPPGIELVPPALEGRVLTTGQPGKSQ